MQAHDLHQHLVGVGGAVEGAGARAVIRFRFRFQQFRPAHLAFGIKLAGFRLFIIRQSAGHRAGWNEDGRQMAEGQRADN